VTVVRPATDADVDAIAAIYAREVREGFASFETEPPPRSRWEEKLRSTEPGDHLLVAEIHGTVVGYAHSSSYRPRPGYRHTRETSLYLHPSAQGHGLGRRLYDELVPRMRGDGVHLALAGVALPNPASVRLHESVGFEHLGTMREVGLKFDRWIDVAWYQLRL
jgi:L-amino acid N-acyltransferase YncA